MTDLEEKEKEEKEVARRTASKPEEKAPTTNNLNIMTVTEEKQNGYKKEDGVDCISSVILFSFFLLFSRSLLPVA